MKKNLWAFFLLPVSFMMLGGNRPVQAQNEGDLE